MQETSKGLSIFKPLEDLLAEHDENLAFIRKAYETAMNPLWVNTFRDALMFKTNSSVNVQKVELAEMEKELDVESWARAFALSNFGNFLSAQKREEWMKTIQMREVPAFTKETVISTFESMYAQLNHNFSEKVDGVFRRLSKQHVTNSPEGFFKRMIFATYIGSSYDEYLADLIQCIHILVEKPIETREARIMGYHILNTQPRDGKWYPILGGWLKVRRYKNGNTHLEVHPDIAWRLNEVLASFGNNALAIPEKFRKVTKKQQAKPLDLKQEYLYPDSIYALARAAKAVCRYPLADGETQEKFFFDVSFSTEPHLIALFKRFGGEKVQNGNKLIMLYTYNPSALFEEIVDLGVIPEYKSHQYYPTPKRIAEAMIEGVDLSVVESVLEPSAGIGSLVDAVIAKEANKGFTFDLVDISRFNCEILKGKYAKTHKAEIHNEDFLTFKNQKAYDLIVMNPPFTGNQAATHIQHAYRMLKPNGILKAIVPAGFDRNLGFGYDLSDDTYKGFDNTSIGVRILTVVKV